MDLALAVVFILVGFISFIVGWYEERFPSKGSDDQEEKDYMVIVFFALATLFFVFAGITFLGITTSYYDIGASEYTTIYLSEYRPFAWALIFVGILSLVLTTGKVFERLGAGEVE